MNETIMGNDNQIFVNIVLSFFSMLFSTLSSIEFLSKFSVSLVYFFLDLSYFNSYPPLFGDFGYDDCSGFLNDPSFSKSFNFFSISKVSKPDTYAINPQNFVQHPSF